MPLSSRYNSRMIDEIEVKNLALIRSAALTPCEGLTVITGETGAGKTALLSALKLMMGARASSDMVRDGEDSAVIPRRNLKAIAKQAGTPSMLPGNPATRKSSS